MSSFGEHHQSFSSPSFACWLLYLNTIMVLGTSLAWVSLHSNSGEQGLISWLVFQAGRHLAPAGAQLSVDLLSSLSKLYVCRHFPKPHAVLQMSDLSHLLPASGVVLVASGLALPVPFCLLAFLYGIFWIFYHVSSVWDIVHLPQCLCWAGWLLTTLPGCFSLTVPGATHSLDPSQRLKPHYCKLGGLRPWLPLDLHEWAYPQESLV